MSNKAKGTYTEPDSDSDSDSGSDSGGSHASRPASPTTLFEDSLFSLFAHNQPAHGDPGDVRTFTHTNLPPRYVRLHQDDDDNAEGASEAPSSPPSAQVPAHDDSSLQRRRRRRRDTKIRYRLAQNDGDNTKLFAHHQWDAGLYMAEMIAEHSCVHPPTSLDHPDAATTTDAGKGPGTAILDVRAKTVVELGAGTGLPSLVAALMGARQTVITDYPDPKILDNLRGNLDLALGSTSTLTSSSSSPTTKEDEGRGKRKVASEAFRTARRTTTVEGLCWGKDDEETAVLSHLDPGRVPAVSGQQRPRFDMILAADVLWVSSAHAHLIHSIRRLLARHAEARCILIAGFHTGRPAVTRFLRLLAQPDATSDCDDDDDDEDMARRAGIVPDWEAVHGGIWERGVGGRQRPWSGAWIPTRSQMHPPTSQADTEDSNGDDRAPAEEEEMGDVSERAAWVVVASLRWADL